jgi:hypothetical protein
MSTPATTRVGAIADAASGFDDGRDCHSPQVVFSSPAEGSRAFGPLVFMGLCLMQIGVTLA